MKKKINSIKSYFLVFIFFLWIIALSYNIDSALIDNYSNS